jgi:hypothetical protein
MFIWLVVALFILGSKFFLLISSENFYLPKSFPHQQYVFQLSTRRTSFSNLNSAIICKIIVDVTIFEITFE